ncbi:MAG: DUF169 domain-containing protein [Fusobacterium sp. JB019]|nr:DUF169 domain-containing protein [Fusobacterium sp. JB019]
MNSNIVNCLKPYLETVVLLRSNEKPKNSIQAQPEKYVCIMSLYAQVTKNSKIAVFDRETYGCPGAKAGLGFGSGYSNNMGGYETFSAFFSKGIEDAKNPEEYRKIAEQANPHVRKKLIEGERFQKTREKAYKWITEELPIYNWPEKYVILKPLKDLKKDEIPESVIFNVNPLQLTALITLTGSIRKGINETITPQGAACQMIGAYVFKEGESNNPKAVLGMIDLAARKTIQNILPKDLLTYAVPWNLFLELEKEAKEGIFKSPLWQDIIK